MGKQRRHLVGPDEKQVTRCGAGSFARHARNAKPETTRDIQEVTCQRCLQLVVRAGAVMPTTEDK
jgi:hypothetical protein